MLGGIFKKDNCGCPCRDYYVAKCQASVIVTTSDPPHQHDVHLDDHQHDVHVDDHHEQVEYVEHCYQDGYHTKCENRAVGMPRKVRVLSANVLSP